MKYRLVPMALMLLCMGSSEAARYLHVLPGTAAVRQVLEQAPQIAVAQQQQQVRLSQARQQLLGSHEWIASTAVQQRAEQAGNTYHEEEVSLTRAIRWPGKTRLDKTLSEQIGESAGLAFEDAWHEAGRNLLSGWFDWLRAASESRLLQEQLALFEEQVTVTEKRVKAGDVPRIEIQLVQADLERAQAALLNAQSRADLMALSLQRDFPALQHELPEQLDVPEDFATDDSHWVAMVVDNNHETALAKAEAGVAKLAAERARQDRLADPAVGIKYARERNAQERLVGLTFSIPFPGAARQAAYQTAHAEALRMQRLAQQIQLKVEHDARADVLMMHGQFRQWQLLTALATTARTNAQTIFRGYSLGEFSLREAQLARRQAMDSILAAQVAQLDALQSQARLLLDAHEIWTPDEIPQQ